MTTAVPTSSRGVGNPTPRAFLGFLPAEPAAEWCAGCDQLGEVGPELTTTWRGFHCHADCYLVARYGIPAAELPTW